MVTPPADGMAVFDEIAADVEAIWPDADAAALATEFLRAIGVTSDRGLTPSDPLGSDPALESERWTEADVVLITYGDSVVGSDGRRPMQHLTDLVRTELSDAFGVVHVLPFAPSSSDRGFAVIDYRQVDPAQGTWDDLAELRQHVDVMYDLVVNHISTASDWFQDFLADREPGRGYILTADPEADLGAVVRPRSLPLLTAFDTAAGRQHVWTTFSADQVDLDWHEPDLVAAMLSIIDLFIEQGARFLRLDAIAYLWKEIGTRCVHLPQTHGMVRLIHALLAVRAPHVSLLTETNVPDAENRSYFGGGAEAHIVYNFTLPPLLIDGLVAGRVDRLVTWLNTAPAPPPGTTMMNFLSSHDGIGVRPAEGYLTDDEIGSLVDLAQDRGGFHGTYDRSGQPMPYEINVALPDLFGGPDDAHMVPRILLAHTVVLALAGIAAIYVNSIMATTNDVAAVEADGVRRSINRGRVAVEDIPRHPGSWRFEVFDGLRQLATLRRRHRAFHPDASQAVSHDDSVLRITRTSTDGDEVIEVVCNFASTPRAVAIDGHRTDLLTGRAHTDTITLGPYDTAWLI